MAAGIKVTGLDAYVRPLRGKVFKDVNRELRVAAKRIAGDIRPEVEQAVKESRAPQAPAMARTVRVHSDRVPVVVIGKVNPRFATTKFRRAGQSAQQSKMRRGALAHGVVYGPRGGRKDTRAAENYYRIGRDDSGGPVGRSVASRGPAMRKAQDAYLREYVAILRRYGFTVKGV